MDAFMSQKEAKRNLSLDVNLIPVVMSAKIPPEAGQTVAACFSVMKNGERKVRAPQSRMPVNDRPQQVARPKARNRATETSVLSYGETR